MRIEVHRLRRGQHEVLEARLFTDQRENAEAMRKAVTASRYAGKGNGHWCYTYPLSVDKCHEMREAWGDLKIHKSVSEWYRAAAAQRQAQVARATQTDADLRTLPTRYPELNERLFGDQRVTAAWVADLYRGGGLLADEVGTGKTLGAIAGLLERQVTGPVLIVCPKISVKAVWHKEFAKYAPHVPVYLGRGTRPKREKAIAAFLADTSELKVLVITAEMLRLKAVRSKGRVTEFLGYEYPELFDVEWSGCVVDESQKLMGSMDVVKGNLAGEGLKGLTYAANRFKLAMSATPFGKGGRIDALFGTLHWLWPDEFPSKWAWLARYFEVYSDKVFVRGGRGATKEVKRVGPVQDESKLWADLGPRVLRRTMEEVSPAHRGLKHYIEVPVEMDSRQAKQYAQFAEDAELAVEGGIISTVGTLDFMTRCRQFANGVLRKEGGRVVYTGESAKIDKLLLHLERLEVGRKVVIASQYNEFLDAVEARLAKEGYAWHRLDGSTTDPQRERMMNAFQGEGGPNLFLLNGQAGGVSITLDAADELHALDEMYPPEANTQLFGRIFRRGRVHEVFFYLYRSMGTIDEVIGTNVGARHEEQLRLLDGRRGVAYVRKLAKYREEE